MKRLMILVAVVLFFTACNQNTAPEGVINREEMLDVMVDMQLTDAYLNQIYNNDTMKMQAHSRYNYIFKKFKTDSAGFSKSLKFYSKDPLVLDSMYSQVSDSLTRLQENLRAKANRDNKIDTKKSKASSLYDYMFGQFRTDSLKFTTIFKYDSLDVKELFVLYNKVADTTTAKDSLITKPEPINNSEKPKEFKNDLPTK